MTDSISIYAKDFFFRITKVNIEQLNCNFFETSHRLNPQLIATQNKLLVNVTRFQINRKAASIQNVCTICCFVRFIFTIYTSNFSLKPTQHFSPTILCHQVQVQTHLFHSKIRSTLFYDRFKFTFTFNCLM